MRFLNTLFGIFLYDILWGLEYSMGTNRGGGVGSSKRRWIILSRCFYPMPTNGQVIPCSYHNYCYHRHYHFHHNYSHHQYYHFHHSFPQFITSASLIIQSVHTAQGALAGLGKTFLKQLQSLLCTHKLGDSRNIYFRPFFTQGTGLKNKTLRIERRGHFNALMLKMSTNHFDIF